MFVQNFAQFFAQFSIKICRRNFLGMSGVRKWDLYEPHPICYISLWPSSSLSLSKRRSTLSAAHQLVSTKGVQGSRKVSFKLCSPPPFLWSDHGLPGVFLQKRLGSQNSVATIWGSAKLMGGGKIPDNAPSRNIIGSLQRSFCGERKFSPKFSDRSFLEPPWGHGRPRLRVMDVRAGMIVFP